MRLDVAFGLVYGKQLGHGITLQTFGTANFNLVIERKRF